MAGSSSTNSKDIDRSTLVRGAPQSLSEPVHDDDFRPHRALAVFSFSPPSAIDGRPRLHLRCDGRRRARFPAARVAHAMGADERTDGRTGKRHVHRLFRRRDAGGHARRCHRPAQGHDVCARDLLRRVASQCTRERLGIFSRDAHCRRLGDGRGERHRRAVSLGVRRAAVSREFHGQPRGVFLLRLRGGCTARLSGDPARAQCMARRDGHHRAAHSDAAVVAPCVARVAALARGA